MWLDSYCLFCSLPSLSNWIKKKSYVGASISLTSIWHLLFFSFLLLLLLFFFQLNIFHTHCRQLPKPSKYKALQHTTSLSRTTEMYQLQKQFCGNKWERTVIWVRERGHWRVWDGYFNISKGSEVCENIVHVKISYPLPPMPWTVFLPLPSLFLLFPLYTCSLFNSLDSTLPISLPTTTFLGEHPSKATLKALKAKLEAFRTQYFWKIPRLNFVILFC